MSECSNFSEDEDDDEGEEGGMGNFTSTVCVNFSEDDLRLATIPGQVKVMDRDILLVNLVNFNFQKICSLKELKMTIIFLLESTRYVLIK